MLEAGGFQLFPQMEALGHRLFGEHLEKVTSMTYAIRLIEA